MCPSNLEVTLLHISNIFAVYIYVFSPINSKKKIYPVFLFSWIVILRVFSSFFVSINYKRNRLVSPPSHIYTNTKKNVWRSQLSSMITAADSSSNNDVTYTYTYTLSHTGTQTHAHTHSRWKLKKSQIKNMFVSNFALYSRSSCMKASFFVQLINFSLSSFFSFAIFFFFFFCCCYFCMRFSSLFFFFFFCCFASAVYNFRHYVCFAKYMQFVIHSDVCCLLTYQRHLIICCYFFFRRRVVAVIYLLSLVPPACSTFRNRFVCVLRVALPMRRWILIRRNRSITVH